MMSRTRTGLGAILFAAAVVACGGQDPPPPETPTAAPAAATSVRAPADTPAPTATPEPPVRFRELGSLTEGGAPRQVAVLGDVAYLADNRGGLRIVDVSDPREPVEVAAYDPQGSTAGQGVAVVGELVFLADGLGLRVLEVADAGAPEEVGFLHTPGFATSPLLAGPVLYLADREGGLLAVDVSDPAQPERLSQVFEAGSVRAVDVAISGSHAFVAMHGEGVRVVDVSDPASLREVGAFDTPGVAEAVWVGGDRLYVADGESGLRIFDLSVPESPTLLGAYETGALDYARDVVVAGAYAFLAIDGGVLALDVSDPASPFLAGVYETQGGVLGLALAKPYLYLAMGNQGLRILEVETD